MKSFYLLLIALLFSSASFAQYTTPGTGVKWNLDSLVQYSAGAVTLSSSDYLVNTTIFIRLNDTLAITSDATVKFNTGTYFDVNGTIIINPPTNVTFTAQSNTNGYLGMRIDSSNSSLLRKLTFEYAVALRITDCSPTIDSCIFRYNNNSTSTNFGTSTIVLSRSKSVIKNSQFLNNQRGAISGALNIANAPQIINNIFQGNNTQNANVPQINMSASGSDTMRILNNQLLRSSTNSGGIGFLATNSLYVIITGNIIKNNRYGLTFNGGSNINALVSYNQVDSNNIQNDPLLGGSGIAFYGGTATSHQNVIVTGNLFRWNLWGITINTTTTGGGAKPNLGNITNTDTTDDGKNIFINNTNSLTPNIDLYNNNVDSIYAQNNYWGSEDISVAESHIFHKLDNVALGFVNYLPLLGTLPVKLTAFTAKTDTYNVLLNWKTASENNSDYFSVEKSFNGSEFKSIGKVTATGTTSSVHMYHFTDANALQHLALLYYRLKFMDRDGKYTYSQVISVKRSNGTNESFVKLYPAIVTGSQSIQTEITSRKNQIITIQFYNSGGSLLMQTFKTLLPGKNLFTISINKALPNGQILVRFTGQDIRETKTIIKQ